LDPLFFSGPPSPLTLFFWHFFLPRLWIFSTFSLFSCYRPTFLSQRSSFFVFPFLSRISFVLLFVAPAGGSGQPEAHLPCTSPRCLPSSTFHIAPPEGRSIFGFFFPPFVCCYFPTPPTQPHAQNPSLFLELCVFAPLCRSVCLIICSSFGLDSPTFSHFSVKVFARIKVSACVLVISPTPVTFVSVQPSSLLFSFTFGPL